MPFVYHYHHSSKQYTGFDHAEESPLEPGVHLLPANATFVEPPITEPGYVPVWENTAWIIKSKEILPENDTDETDPWIVLRQKRNQLLAETDYLFLRDAPIMNNENEWKAYRQLLRDLPANTTNPSLVVFPIQPNKT